MVFATVYLLLIFYALFGNIGLLAVKRNQPALYDEITLVFEAYDVDMAPTQIFEQEFLDKDQGRIERRIYSLTNEVGYLEAKANGPRLKCMGRVRSIPEVNVKTSDENRYFISSRQLEVEEFAKAVRSRWGIENKLHWDLDIVFRDGENRARIRNSTVNIVTLKHITLNLLKMVPDKKVFA